MIPKEEGRPMVTACGTPSYVAPEIIEGKGYDLKVDCWSLGVILYVMLCGFPPFYDDDNDELFKLIKDGKYDFPNPYWDNVSDNAKDLINKLLVIDNSKRLTTDEILKHPWLTGKNYSDQALVFDYQKFKASKLVYIINFLYLEICNHGKTYGKPSSKNGVPEEVRYIHSYPVQNNFYQNSYNGFVYN
jgi:serine/threonine protein kinase